MVSCKIFSHFGFRIQQLRSTLSGRHFGAKTSQTLWCGSTHFNSGSSFPDPDWLTCCTIYRCLFVEIQLLRNQNSLCQHIFYNNGLMKFSPPPPPPPTFQMGHFLSKFWPLAQQIKVLVNSQSPLAIRLVNDLIKHFYIFCKKIWSVFTTGHRANPIYNFLRR